MMAKIGRLTNHTRAVQRPPYLPKRASRDVIARLLPVIASRPSNKRQVQGRQPQQQTKQQSQPVKPVQNGRPNHPQAQPAQNGRTHHGTPAASSLPAANGVSKPNGIPSSNGKQPPSLRVPQSQPPKFAPKPYQPHKPPAEAADGRATGQAGPKNGRAHNPSPSAKNGAARGGQHYKPEDIFGDFAPVPSTGAQAAAQPAVQMPLESKSDSAEEPVRGTRPAQPEPKPASPQPSNHASVYEHGQQHSAPRRVNPQPGNGSALEPALQKIFREQPGLPAQAAVLGVGEDGFPVLLDVYDPAPGALVIIGDEREEQLNILRSAAISLAARGTPRSVQIMILTCDPQQWSKWISKQGYERFSIGIQGVDDLDGVREWVLRLGDWIEQRRTGQRSGPPILVILDTLSFLPRLSYDIRLNFEWMAKEGPAAQIWPIAAISSELAQMLASRHLLRSFHTHVYGFVDRPDFYVRNAGLTSQAAEEFAEPGVFAVQVGEDWLRMRVAGR